MTVLLFHYIFDILAHTIFHFLSKRLRFKSTAY